MNIDTGFSFTKQSHLICLFWHTRSRDYTKTMLFVLKNQAVKSERSQTVFTAKTATLLPCISYSLGKSAVTKDYEWQQGKKKNHPQEIVHRASTR